MSPQPLCIDLFCGLGGWTEGFLAEGYQVIGFDVEQHIYGDQRYPAQLVLQDVCTLHGSQFRDATIIVASSPCQEFSYRAMPWKRAKALGPPDLGMHLFAQARRIQLEAIEASGRFIPMIQENVRGAQPWVGRAATHYGSYYLWGDVPALMPVAQRAIKTVGHANIRDGHAHTRHLTNQAETDALKSQGGPRYRAVTAEAVKVPGLSNGHFPPGGLAQGAINNEGEKGALHGWSGGKWTSDAAKQGGGWWHDSSPGTLRSHGSKSNARKAASARIAKIPAALASHIAHVYKPRDAQVGVA